MKTFFFALTALVALAQTAAANTPDVRGVWTAADGSGAARIEACKQEPAKLCAIIVADQPEPGAPSRIGEIVLSGLEPTGRDRLRGRYHDAERTLPATLRLRGADRIEMRVCVGVFCATEEYRRTAS